ncbi:hypothetical protein [Ferrimicrobium acidiphilum]|uniref:Uncharacterized protein n=1 Tax=Ferrimicrobium acidiphilum DSM 19497 TaxID=1121877 RepID=A0A0D8FYS3_9ACTN|nr:hypothetical protein [Ferrimicrobium acidiphilum]KJE77772.1 hypothetical protein FEAC_05210 [Ferrimicrobium acidiphilum DSM 19497]
MTILPARPRKPRDKAAVEGGVLIVERQILARLRHVKFFSLYELNQAIYELLEELNAQGFQRREGTRKSVFEAVDKPVMRPLPTTAYEYAEWKRPTQASLLCPFDIVRYRALWERTGLRDFSY